ncbi:hypothetical protein BGX33_003472, partial [Mortierella sp. NVP41]
MANKFNDISAINLTLWRVSIPCDEAIEDKPIVLNTIDSKTELCPLDDLSKVFTEQPPEETIHII